MFKEIEKLRKTPYYWIGGYCPSNAPMLFLIKTQIPVGDCSKHVRKMLQFLQSFDNSVIRVVLAVIQLNTLFATPENILLGLIQDERGYVRDLRWRRIQRALTNKEEHTRRLKIHALQIDS